MRNCLSSVKFSGNTNDIIRKFRAPLGTKRFTQVLASLTLLITWFSAYQGILIKYLPLSSDDSCGAPPVPIPNTVVKPINAEGTWLETAWEIRKLLVVKSTHENECFLLCI